MKRAFCLFMTIAALAGCRGPIAQFDPFVPYGPRRVPPPPTGSIGNAVPQPANPYYPNTTGAQSSAQTVPPSAWQSSTPAPSLASNPHAGQAVTGSNVQAGTAANSNLQGSTISPSPVSNNAGNASSFSSGGGNVFSGGGSSFSNGQGAAVASPPAVTNPPVIHSQGGTAPSGQSPSVFGSSGHSAAVQVPAPVGTAGVTNPQLTRTGSQPTTFQTVPPTNSALPNSGVGSTIRSTLGIQMAPSGGAATGVPGSDVPLRGMPVNDATVPHGAPAGAYVPQAVPQAYPAVPQAYPVVPAAAPTAAPTMIYTTTPANVTVPTTGLQAAVGPTAATAVVNNASWTQETVRGNDEPADAAPATFVSSSSATPVAHTAERYGYHPQYQWLRGRLEHSSTENRWKLRYISYDAPEGHMDAFGGSVQLLDHPQLSQLQSGQFVTVRGQLAAENTSSKDYSPLYQVQQISPLD